MNRAFSASSGNVLFPGVLPQAAMNAAPLALNAYDEVGHAPGLLSG